MQMVFYVKFVSPFHQDLSFRISYVSYAVGHAAWNKSYDDDDDDDEAKQHLDLFSQFCTAHRRVSSGMPGHFLSAKNCSFALADLDPHLILGSFSPREPTALRYNCADIACQYIIPRYLHIYTITLYLVPWRHITRHHNISPYHPNHNVLLVAWISSTDWSRNSIFDTINDYCTQF